jgi:predicted NUDIX family phosphoesterase
LTGACAARYDPAAIIRGRNRKKDTEAMAREEKVLVVPRKALEQIGAFEGLTQDVDRYIREFFTEGVCSFMPRSLAERDPSHKQLIPYVIISCGGRYLTYVRGRRAGEPRLVGNRSIGIGGHINPTDDLPLFNTDFYETYLNAVQREVAEEVSVEADHTDRVVALLNDDSNEVGSVHLGVVHLWALDSPRVVKREQMITQMAFMSPAELQKVRENMESWSRLCLDNLFTPTLL